MFLYFLSVTGFRRDDSDQAGLGARGGGSVNVTLGQADLTRWRPADEGMPEGVGSLAAVPISR